MTVLLAIMTLVLPPAGGRQVVDVDPQGESQAVVRVEVPVRDVQEMWMPCWEVPRQERKWFLSATSAPMVDVPYVAYFNLTGRNACSIGVDTLEFDTQIASKINQERGVWEVSVTVAARSPVRPFKVTLDCRGIDWQQALADWRDSLTFPKGRFPEAAWKPVYCSWYAVHAALTQQWVVDTADVAAALGFKTFILDDGWSYDESKRVTPETLSAWYRDTGRWDRFSKKKFPDFRTHREHMRMLGLKYLVWVSPYFIGTRSEEYRRLGFDRKGMKPFEGHVLADPADRAVMDAVDDQLVRLLKESDVDGLKIDFLDEIAPSVEKPRAADSLAHVERMMAKLRAAKPDGLFEFRQNYATPLTAHLATQFRAGDVPFEWLANLRRIAQIRLTMGDSVPIHADPIYWSASETPDNINRHFLAAMAGVPMLSMDLVKMSAPERTTVKRWLDFYARHVERFQKAGRWRVLYHNGGIAAVTSILDGATLLLVNDAHVLPRLAPTIDGRESVVLNLTYETLDFGRGRAVPPADAAVIPAAFDLSTNAYTSASSAGTGISVHHDPLDRLRTELRRNGAIVP